MAHLKDSNITWTLLGHSERRVILREQDEFIACKTKAALDGGIGVILCCGESLEEREQGITTDVVTKQLDAVNKAIGKDGWKNVVIAYEPIWAIGTGKVASTGRFNELRLSDLGSITDRCDHRASTGSSRRNPQVAQRICVLRSRRSHESYLWRKC